MASSSSQPLLTTHDVFVSFRGEDTRRNFIAFLRQALSRNGIEVFKDDEDIEKGESIAPELLQAIQGSRLFVVVFSKNYASSTWCLRELVEICNCKETSSRQVLPIFYDVDPSEVRKQSGDYGIAFVKHEERFRDKLEEVERWREALTQVANLGGWDTRTKSQDQIIDEIVAEIQKKLGPKYSSLPNDNLVGMDSRVEELTKLLHSGSDNGVRVVGISGMGGIGKTALARALYERISHQYDSLCFIENVNDTFQKFGALGVQNQLLSESLNDKNLEIYNVSHGTYSVWTRLRHKRALIVLDNVRHAKELNMFSGNRESLLRECLGGGSRIIIISEDQEILRTHGVDDLYLVKPLGVQEACQLFCRNAFKRNYIMSGYEYLASQILSRAEGHPLAIQVLGSSLFGKEVSQCESILARLKDVPSKGIMDVLRIAYDDLDSMNQDIFLDIACFFDCEKEQRVSEILDFRGFHPEVGLGVLANKSLITINYECVNMSSMLIDLGKLIVKEKYPREPRKWNRLWDYEDLRKVMSDNMDETNIEAIVIRDNEYYGPTMTVGALSKLRKLKLLMLPLSLFDGFSGNINDLSNELGYIEWGHYPCHCLPRSFEPHKLVELILPLSNIKELWVNEEKSLPNLKHLDLSYSTKLEKLQNFGEAINLRTLCLRGCRNLKQIDDFPRNLTSLKLEDCKSLTYLPNFSDALNLEVINLEGCTKLKQIDASIGLLKKLNILNLKNCESLESLPNNILKLSCVEYLCLFGCSQLYKKLLLEEPRDALEGPSHSQSSPSILSKCNTWPLQLGSREHKDSVNWLLPSLSILPCMRHLDLSFCNLLQVPAGIGNLHSLQILSLGGNNFTILPNLKELSKLVHLNLEHCKQLENLPELPSQTDMSSLSNWQKTCFLFLSIEEYDEYRLGINIFNCPKLAKRQSCSRMCFAWIKQIIKAYNIEEIDYDHFIRCPRISSIIPGSEIPSWFNRQHVCTNNSIRFDASHFFYDQNRIGVAFCAIFVVHKQMGPRKPEPVSEYNCRIQRSFRADLVTDESDHLWLFYFRGSHVNYNCCGNDFRLEIVGGEGYAVEVKKYGYRVIYKDDIELSNSAMIHTQTSLPQKRKLTEIEENE